MSKQRYSIIPGDFAEEERADVGHFRVLNLIGRHTDAHGWCRLKQVTIGERVGLTRETVCRKLRDLVAWGYVEKRAQDATGRAIFYRTIMDRPQPPPSIDDEGDDAGDDCETLPGRVSDGSQVAGTCEPGVTSGVSAQITSGVTPAITQNDPFFSTEGKNPNPNGARAVGAKGEKSDQRSANDAAKLLAALRADGVALPVVEHLLRPILEGKRFSSADRLGRLRELRDSAKGIPTPALDKAAELVLQLDFQTIKPERIAEAIATVRKAGAMVGIRVGSAQWAAWVKYLEVENPREAEVMRKVGVWQVRAPWPPGHAPAAVKGAA